MSGIADSRDPLGVGILILQDHGYKKAGFADHNRGGLVGIRVKDRWDSPGDFGEWEPDDETRGPLGGGCFWSRVKTNAGAWQFAWPVVIAGETGNSLGPTTPNVLRGEITPGSRPLPTPTTPGPTGPTGGAGATGAAGPPQVAVIPKGSTIKVGGNFVKLTETAGGKVNPNPFLGSKVNVIGVGLQVKPFGVGLFPGVNFLEPFGLNVQPFGVGLPLGGDVGGGSINRSDKPAVDEATSAWYSGDLDSRAVILNKMRPRTKSWAGDTRYDEIIQSSPVGWPDFPAGHHGIALAASNEDEQIVHYHPTDPRLIAVNAGGSPTLGTIVADTNDGDAIDLQRQARLQSMVWVVKAPSGSLGMLSINKRRGASDNRKGVNALAWNLGPSGQFDAMGGLVVDIPLSDSFKRGERIIAHASAHYGGPFDVGAKKDIHRIGEDSDGNPINSLHISTKANYKRAASAFSINEDGPLDFGFSYPGPGDLVFPVRVHLGFDNKTGRWRWWTTTMFYVPPQNPTPVDPPPTPETPPPTGPTTPGPTGGPHEPNPRVQPNADPVADPYPVGATTMETWFPAMGFRNQMISTGAEDVQHSTKPSLHAVRRMDERAPLTVRIEGYGAQGGPTGGPYMDDGGDWSYTQKPGTSRFRQTAGGGMVYLPPEVTLADIDESLAPAGVTRSSTYVVAGTGVCYGAGLPELATGGLKTGYSWCADTDGDLAYSRHDTAGDATEVIRFNNAGIMEFGGYGELRFADASGTLAVTTTPIIIPTWSGTGPVSGFTVSAAAGTIQVNHDGIYSVQAQFSFQGTVSTSYEVHVRVGGVEQDAGFHRYLGTATDEGSASLTTLLDLNEDDVVSLYAQASKNADFDIIDAQFVVVRVR